MLFANTIAKTKAIGEIKTKIEMLGEKQRQIDKEINRLVDLLENVVKCPVDCGGGGEEKKSACIE